MRDILRAETITAGSHARAESENFVCIGRVGMKGTPKNASGPLSYTRLCGDRRPDS